MLRMCRNFGSEIVQYAQKEKAVLVGKIRKEEEKNFCRVNIIYCQRRTTFCGAKTSGKWYKIESDSTPYVQK